MINLDLLDISPNIISAQSEHVIIAHQPLVAGEVQEITAELTNQILDSWKRCLTVYPVDALSDGENRLRQPQVSALFEILGHLTGHNPGDATVVMPTGTGKTETMLATVCGLPVQKVLVIVPNDSLRKQTFKKFLTLGMLRNLYAIKQDTLNPIVALIEGGLNNNNELSLSQLANVLVTTPQSLTQANAELRNALYNSCSHLIIDEAHHVEARSWREIKQAFESKPILQFTATPFRQDQQKVGGKIIYNFPISRAQELGLFRKIRFKSVYEVNDIAGHRRVAELAISQLREDIRNNLDHILMARCGKRSEANDIGEIYRELAPDLNPVVIHSGVSKLKSKQKAIREKQHKIIICVDMLGEGFDLPELKVCALHTIHKSLAITLQFAGRFVRHRPDLGDPTFVANVCDQNVEGALKHLYIEDPDWNKVLQYTSEANIKREIEFQQIIENSSKTGKEIPIENLRPTVSVLVFEVESANINLNIEQFPLESGEELVSSIVVPNSNLLVLITKVDTITKWAPQSDLTQADWRLIVLYYEPSEGLLFLHDSAKIGTRKRLIDHISIGAKLLNGDRVFKSFGEIERLVLQNAGLNKGQRGNLRYVMYTGTDIESSINELAQGSSYRSNMSGRGYERGNKVDIGCSHKGRIWSMNNLAMYDWMEWCKQVGQKLNDPNLDPNTILDKVLRTKTITALPELTPIGIDWPDYFFEYGHFNIHLTCSSGQPFRLDSACIEIKQHTINSINFTVTLDNNSCDYEYSVTEHGYSVSKVNGADIIIVFSSINMPLEQYFSENASPAIFYEDGTKLFENLHIVRPDGFILPKYDQASLESRQWQVNIHKESQGQNKNPDSIQYAMIQELKQKGYWIIFDDDGANEIADIVAFKDEGETLAIEFYHLKYSSGDAPGSRIKDFYEVCGQVIKGCKWVGELEKIITQLKKREKLRMNTQQEEQVLSRIEQGEFREFDLLLQHASRLQKEYRFFIVQPGLTTANVSEDILALLGSIDIYVKETTGISLRVIGSP
ncbi:DEAD/DEAH box helicase [Methylophaga sp. OBS3]|uniref:DEAD/DEAH box helicase n=1 Tax=Methylophaga sp. OBS3 TaxID=2991934 RepID=UPI002257D74E|nr:DEAD/DEAH box helicase family protein [Methylophaga sp. OBS3]MCX4190268.1 DEAD/DEAH box helicase family protein [Methylophaga sp. OBS3]